jgi:hypothetical protein
MTSLASLQISGSPHRLLYRRGEAGPLLFSCSLRPRLCGGEGLGMRGQPFAFKCNPQRPASTQTRRSPPIIRV